MQFEIKPEGHANIVKIMVIINLKIFFYVLNKNDCKLE